MLGRALDVVLSAAPVETVSGRCSRGRSENSALSGCQACVDACPNGALSLDPLKVCADSCDGCDRCVAACSVDALGPNKSRRQEHLAALLRVRRGASVTFACGLAASTPDATPVNCVATMDPWSVVVCLLLGAAHVELCRGDCAGCSHGRGATGDACEAIVDAAARIGGALQLGKCSLRSAPLVDESAPHPRLARRSSRRGLFSGLLRSGTDTAARAVASNVQADHVGDLRVRDLAAALLAKRHLASMPIPAAKLGGRPRIADNCTRCGTCAASCPTGALHRGEPDADNPSPNLMLYAARCTNCGVCAASCPERALTVEPTIDLAECAPRPIVLIEALAVSCVHCGAPALAPFLPVCPSCYKNRRGLSYQA